MKSPFTRPLLLAPVVFLTLVMLLPATSGLGSIQDSTDSASQSIGSGPITAQPTTGNAADNSCSDVETCSTSATITGVESGDTYLVVVASRTTATGAPSAVTYKSGNAHGTLTEEATTACTIAAEGETYVYGIADVTSTDAPTFTVNFSADRYYTIAAFDVHNAAPDPWDATGTAECEDTTTETAEASVTATDNDVLDVLGMSAVSDDAITALDGDTLAINPTLTTTGETNSGAILYETEATAASETLEAHIAADSRYSAVAIAIAEPLTAPVISISPTAIDNGQSSTLSTTTSFLGGLPTYTCQWLEEAPGASSYSDLGSSFTGGTCVDTGLPTVSTGTLSTTGTWSFELQVTDSESPTVTVHSAAISLTVNADPTVSVTPSAPDIDHGQTVTLTASTSGGTGADSYKWYSGTSCTGTALATTAAYTTPALTATTTYCVSTTDSASTPLTATTTVTVTVSAAVLSVTITPSAPSIDHGQTITLTANPAGGTGSDTYDWYADSTCTGTVQATTQTYTTAALTATTTFCVSVTDSAYSPVTVTATDTVTVSAAALSLSVTPSAPSIDSGQTVTLTATAAGGTGADSYKWYSGSSCTGTVLATTAAYTTAALTATTTYCVSATDSAYSPVTVTDTVTVTVSAALTVAISPSAPSIDHGQTVTLTAVPSGGTGADTYAWYSGSSCTGTVLVTTAAYTTPALTATTTYCVAVTDSAYSPVTVTDTVTVTVSAAALSATVTPAAPSIDNGQTVTLTANPTGGTGADSYNWYSGSSCSGTVLVTTQAYTTAALTATTTFCVAVTDSAYSPVTVTATDTVTVSLAALSISITPNAPSIDNGQTVTLTTAAAGGTGSDSYKWYSGSSCTGTVLASTAAYTTPALTSTTTYCASATDSAYSPVTVTATDTVTVSSAALSVTISPSAPSIDNGQTVTLTANPVGGTGSDTYKWYSGSSCSGTVLVTTQAYTTPALTSTTTYCVAVTDSAYSPVTVTATATVTVSASALSVTISPSAPSIDNGQTVTLTANPSGGTGADTYKWYSGSSCSGTVLVTTQAYTTPALSATTTYCVAVTDSAYSPVTVTATDSVTVSSSALSVSMSPTSPSIDNGQAVTLTANPSGGTGTDSYKWYSGSSCSGTVLATTQAYTTPALTSTTTYCVAVTDSAYSPVTVTATDTVTVSSAALSVSISPSAPSIDDGQTVTLTANPSGGTGSDTYKWYSGSSCSGTVLVTTQAYTTPALTSTTTYCVAVTDSAYSPATVTATVTVTVSSSALSATVSPSAPSIDNGQTVTLTANPSGGTGADTYKWYSGSSCSGSILVTTQAYTTPALTATTTYCVAVTDSAYSPVKVTATDTVTVSSAALSISITPSSPSIDNGQTVTLTANPSGGTGADTYKWYSGSSCSGSVLVTTQAYTTPSLTSTTTYCVAVTDSAYSPVTVTATDTVTVSSSALSVSISPSAPSIDNGQTVTLTANPSGGTGADTYKWYSGASCSGSVLATTQAYTTPALTSTSTYCLAVTDSAYSPVTVTATATVTVSSSALSVAISPSAPSIDNGQTVTLTANPAGGTGSDSYKWYSGSSCSGSTLVTTQAYTTPALTATTTYCVAVTDSAYSPVTVTATATVTVSSSALSVTISPSSPSIDNGQTVTLTANPSGGTGADSYQWYSGSSCTGSVLVTTQAYTTPALSATTTYCVSVTDSAYSPVTVTATDTVTVSSSALSVSISPSAPSIDNAQTVTLTANPSGGTGADSYKWYSGASCSGTVLATTQAYATPSLTSTTTYCASVTDSAYSPVTVTATVTVTVSSSALSVSISPSSPSIDHGQTVTLTANPSGGTGADSYQWYSGSSCTGTVLAATPAYTTPALTSTTTYCVSVTDSAYSPVTVTATDTVTVSSSALSVAISPSAPSIDDGQTVTLTANPSGGTGADSYMWYSGSSCSGTVLATTQAYTTTALTSTATYCVSVTDSAYSPVTVAATVTVTVSSAALSASISPASPSIDNGQTITLTANPSGGTGVDSYQWYTGSSCSGTVLVTTQAYTTPALTSTTTYCVAVTDSAYSPVTVTATDAVTVSSSALSVSISPSAPSIDNGQTVSLTANPSGGTGADSYKWYSGSSCSGSVLATTQAYTTPALTATTTYCVAVTDSAYSPVTVTATDTVTVSSAALSVSIGPSSPSIDNGQTVTLTANPSGGTGADSYKWYSGSSCSGSVLVTTQAYTTPALTATTSYCVAVTDSAYSPVTVTAMDTVTVSSSALSVTIAPSAPSIDHGQSVSLTANPSGGTGADSYQWYSGSSCTGSVLATTQAYGTPALTATGSYCVAATDSAYSPVTVTATVTVTVSSAVLSVSITPSAPAIDNGQTVTLNANPSGGTGSDSDQWYAGSSCSGSVLATSQAYTTAALTSSASYCVAVTDSAYSPVTVTATVTVTVSSSVLSVAITPSAPSIDNGQTVTLTANPSGGTGADGYQWYSGSSCSGSVLATTSDYTTPALTATHTYCVAVTDSAYSPVTVTATVTVTVSSTALSASISPSAPSIDNGQAVTLTANPSGGTGADSYQWFAGSSCSGSVLATTQAYSTPTLSSTTTYCVAVTDSAYSPVTVTATVTVTVSSSALSVAISPSAPSIDNGQAVTLTAIPSGGTGADAYQWYSGSSCSGSVLATTPAYSTPTLSASQVYCAAVTDRAYSPVTATATVAVTVSASALSVTISPSAPSIDNGQTVSLTANPSGGTGADSYQWYSGSSCSGTVLATSQSYVTPALTSTATYCVSVTDSAYAPVTQSATVTVTVSAAALSASVSPSAPSIDQGQDVALSAVPSGGTGEDSYQWYSGSSCSGTVLATTSSYTTPSLTSSTTYCLAVTDSAYSPVTVTTTDSVTVSASPLSVAVTPSAPNIDYGQAISLMANPSGGTGSDSYQWFAGSTCSGTVLGTVVSYTTPALTASASYCVGVADSAYSPVTVDAVAPITVSAAVLSLGISPSAPSIDNGQSVALDAIPSGGTGSDTFAWYSGSSCSGTVLVTTAGYTTPALTSSTTYCVSATDSAYSPVTVTDTVTVTVSAAALSASISPSGPSIDNGQSITLTVNPSGGTGSDSYAWYAGSSCSGSPLATTQSYATGALTSSSTYCASVTDSAYAPVTVSVTDTVTVSASPLSVSLSPASPSIDNGQAVALTATPSGGTGGDSYAWYSGSSCSGTVLATTAGYSTPTLSSSATYCLALTDSAYSPVTVTATDPVTVSAALLSVSINPSAPSIDDGQSVPLAAVPSGGTGSDSYAWYSGTSCTGGVLATTLGYTTPTLSSSAAYCVAVTDSAYAPVTVTATVSVTVSSAPLSLSISPSAPFIDVGQSISLDAVAAGGTGRNSYAWFAGTSCTGSELGSSASYLAGPLSSTSSFCTAVTDNAYSPVTVAQTVTVSVNPALTAPGTLSVSASVLDSDQTLTVSGAIPSTGTGPYAWAWLVSVNSGSFAPASLCAINAGTGASSSSVETCAVAPNTLSAGDTYAFQLQVSDSSAAGSESVVSGASSTVLANSPLAAPGTPSVSSPVLDSDQALGVGDDLPSSGTAPYAWVWEVSVNGGSLATSSLCPQNSGSGGAPNAVVSCSIPANTLTGGDTYSFVLQVSDSSGAGAETQSSSPSYTVTVNPPLTAGSWSPSSPLVDSGQSLPLIANPSGGSPALHYAWYWGSSSSCGSDTVIPGAILATYTTPGLATATYYCYSVTDSSGAGAETAYSPTSRILVDSDPAAGAISPSSPSMDAGQDPAVTLTSSPSGGTGVWAYQWYIGQYCTAAISGATSSTYLLTPTVTTTFYYSVTDVGVSAGASPAAFACSAGDTVTVNPNLVAGAVTPGSPTIDLGQSLVLTAHPSGGSGSYTIQWYTGAACSGTIPSATSLTLSVSPASTTSYYYGVVDAGTTVPAQSCTAGPDVVTVDPALSAESITPSVPAIDSGQSITLLSHVAGGTSPYGYSWYTGAACTSVVSGATSPSITVSPSVSTTYYFQVLDSSQGSPAASACSAGVTVAVNAPPNAGAVSPSSPSIDSGQSVALASAVSGGTPALSYQWYSSTTTSVICPSANRISGATLTSYTTPSLTATTYYCYVVTDSSSAGAETAYSAWDGVTVKGTLGANPATPASPTVDSGQSVTLTGSASAGTSPYFYQWHSSTTGSGACALGSVLSGATSSAYTSSALTSTTYYCYVITDSSYAGAETTSSSWDKVTVNAPLSAGPITPSAPSIDAGQTLTLSSAASGGLAPYSYQWFTGSACTSPISGATSSSYSGTPAATTTYYYQVTDSSPGLPTASACSAGDTITVNPALTAGGVTPSAPTLDSGQSILLTSAASGGTSPYSYQWYSSTSTSLACKSATKISGATSSTYTTATLTSSTYYCYAVSDSSPAGAETAVSGWNEVTVKNALTAPGVTPSLPSIDSGQAIALTASPSGGVSPYYFQWYSSTTGSGACNLGTAAGGATSSSYTTPSLSSNSYFCYTVTDSSAGGAESASSAWDLVTVNVVLVAGSITPGSPAIDSGQSITLTSAPSGGTPAYAYQWYTGASCATSIVGAVGSSYAATLTASTTYSYGLTDASKGTPAASICSPADTVTVNPTLSAGAITPASPSVTSGTQVTLTSAPSGGTPAYTYQWYYSTSTSLACASATKVSGATGGTYTFTASSTLYYCYVVVDSSPSGSESSASAWDKVTVTAPGLPAVPHATTSHHLGGIAPTPGRGPLGRELGYFRGALPRLAPPARD